jgi:hypothetical protein
MVSPTQSDETSAACKSVGVYLPRFELELRSKESAMHASPIYVATALAAAATLFGHPLTAATPVQPVTLKSGQGGKRTATRRKPKAKVKPNLMKPKAGHPASGFASGEGRAVLPVVHEEVALRISGASLLGLICRGVRQS